MLSCASRTARRTSGSRSRTTGPGPPPSCRPGSGAGSPACGSGCTRSAARCRPGRGTSAGGGCRRDCSSRRRPVSDPTRTDPDAETHGESEARGPIRVLLVDDQSLLRMGFRMILEAEPDLEVVGEASDGETAVAMVGAVSPDVVLMDVRMPGVDGIEATRRVMLTEDPPRVLILTTFDLDEYVYDGLRAGASGFLLKDAPPADLLAAVRTVAGGAAVLAPTATRRLLDQVVPMLPDADRTSRRESVLGALTEREQEVFYLLAAGRSNREIADGLHLSEGTVKIHVGRILGKLELRDRVQAVVLAYESGLVTPNA